jgi:UDP-perosamine 4-acetyltransferase
MKPTIVIIGGGGHGKVIADTIIATNQYQIVGFVDATIPVGSVVFKDIKVITGQDNLASLIGKADYFIVAIGNNKVRADIALMAKKHFKPAAIIHPSAIISTEVEIGEGTVILQGAIVSTGSKIGENTIVNEGVVVDHDCVVGKNVHLSPRTTIGSNSIVADGITTNIGESISSFSKKD